MNLTAPPDAQAMIGGRIDFSRYCVISIWFGCNNNCTICMLGAVKSGLPAISYEGYRKVVIDIMRDGRFENLILSGAEVTTFDDLDRYVRCAASLGWFKRIQIQTNGRRLRDPEYLDHLIDCGVNEFFVSIHGLAETHDAVTRVPGSFGETLAGLRNLSGRKANVISNTVLTRNNFSEIPGLVRFLCAKCVSEIHLWNYFPMESTDKRNLLVPLGDLMNIVPELRQIVQAAGKPLVLKSFPLCLAVEAPVYLDSVFPVTVLPDLFWKQFGECGFGRCVHREAGACRTKECWGLCSAYLAKYGDEKTLLRPITPPRF